MSGGIDKLILLCVSVAETFYQLAREKGVRRWGYGHVIDLRQTNYALPAILYCDGIHNGRHKIEIVDAGRVGRRRALKIIKRIAGNLSGVRICRIDFCVDLFGISVWDLARVCYIGRAQSYQIYRTRKGDTVYLQRTDARTVQIYDKGKLLRLRKHPRARMLRPGEHLTRIEVQLKGGGVPLKKLRQLDRYLDIDLLAGIQFRRLIPRSNQEKPLRSMAAAYLADEVEHFGLHAVLKRYPSSQRAYIQRLFTEEIDGNELPDIRQKMREGIQDWLDDRITFPRFREPDGEE
jgi:hypothetical protein